jgi:hypothetical protein
MSARHDERAARDEWLQSIVNKPAHDANDTQTDPDDLPPVIRAIAGLAVVLVIAAGAVALFLHGLQSSVSP